MSVFAPDYYKDFNCIASLCRHNCCIGWEIDIDKKTMKKYENTEGDFKKRLDESITETDGTNHFILGENERCPFLNNNNLCDIILNLGEDNLCQICADHPRFVNFYEEREEIGLGLSCEEAARVIITKKDKTKIVPLDNSKLKESFFVNYRNKLFSIAQNREKTVVEREKELLAEVDARFSETSWKKWEEIFSSLEILDPSWKNYISLIGKDVPEPVFADFEIPFEQLLCYFLFRHSEPAFLFGDFCETVMFSVLSVRIIRKIFSAKIFAQKSADISTLLEIIRMYSSEIEYCEENTDKLFDLL